MTSDPNAEPYDHNGEDAYAHQEREAAWLAHGYTDDYCATLPDDQGSRCACGGIRRYHAAPPHGCEDCGCTAFSPVVPVGQEALL